ncbi:MAG TPA: NAD(P)-dependent oxidoreductase [Streptosporangiaceae bacterium]|nr:NAD(P)-dependent oxidoreductase [Streptosporangiaceae bacterium]
MGAVRAWPVSAALPAVAVLGGTGCVGGAVTTAFASAGHPVLGVARTRQPGPFDGRFLELDVAAAEPVELARLLASANVRIVVNATGGWLTTDEANEQTHTRLVERLINGLALLPRPPRMIQIGSIHEYGPVPVGTTIDESVTPRPVTSYARSKLAGAEAILVATREGRVDGVVLRAANICGPGVAAASFLGSVVRRLRAATSAAPAELSVGQARRDFLDVRDLAAAVVSAAAAPVTGRVINIGSGEAVLMRDLLAFLIAVSGLPAEVVRVREAPVESKGGDWTLVDTGLAAKVLGWRPRIGMPDSMKDMWDASADF